MNCTEKMQDIAKRLQDLFEQIYEDNQPFATREECVADIEKMLYDKVSILMLLENLNTIINEYFVGTVIVTPSLEIEAKALYSELECLKKDFQKRDNVMTSEKMKAIITTVSFSELQKNTGILEFYSEMSESQEYEKSVGISFEDIGDETDIYIYNIFLGEEYINISNRGTKENPIPNEVLEELVEEWNKH